jgi:hypothetical protein
LFLCGGCNSNSNLAEERETNLQRHDPSKVLTIHHFISRILFLAKVSAGVMYPTLTYSFVMQRLHTIGITTAAEKLYISEK